MKFIKDSFSDSRGGRSRLLELSCGKCKSVIGTYQKDGPGPLKRLYFDRLFRHASRKSGKDYVCTDCDFILGRVVMYEKEKRLAIRLYQDSVAKKVISFKSNVETGLL